jgi:hypothetical protein
VYACVFETSETDELRTRPYRYLRYENLKTLSDGRCGKTSFGRNLPDGSESQRHKRNVRWIVMKREIDQSILIVNGRRCPVRDRAGPCRLQEEWFTTMGCFTEKTRVTIETGRQIGKRMR